MPWLDTMPQYAASGQAAEWVQAGAQSQSNQQAQNLEFLSGPIGKSELSVVLQFFVSNSSALFDHPRFLFLPPHLTPTAEELLFSNHEDNDVSIMLNVLQDGKACDTAFVCHLMSQVWGEFQKYDIARVIQARGVCKYGDDDDYRSSQFSMIVTLMETAGTDGFGEEVEEIFGLVFRWKKWLKVKEKYVLRGGKRDEKNKDENAAWKIWCDAKAELEHLKELDKMPVEADDGKPISHGGSHSR